MACCEVTLLPSSNENSYLNRSRFLGRLRQCILACSLAASLSLTVALAQTPLPNPQAEKTNEHCPDPNDLKNVQCKNLSDNTVQWTIEKPAVSQSLTEYPEIKFKAGQTVMVSADGCVNVSVSNDANKSDWRDYLDPHGPDIDRHHHALIWIPGARVMQDGQPLVVPVGTTPVRIGSVAGRIAGKKQIDPEELVIDDPPRDIAQTLRLGYEGGLIIHPWCSILGTCDTDYPKHPYPDSHNLPPQCSGEAKVVVTIYSGPRPESDPSRALRPFDVVSSEVDKNGFLFAPQWFNTHHSNDITRLEVADECENFRYKNWFLVHRGMHSPCTQQSSFDVPKTLTECLLAPGFGEFHGHVNWAPATYVGKLEFQEVSPDKDVDLQLKTIGDRVLRFPGNKDFGKIAPILTKDSQVSEEYKDSLWLEFATYETTKYFQPPWNEIKFSTRSADYDRLKKLYQDKTAIVTGLLNLDCVHDCHTELHPVFAMAIREKLEFDIGRDDDPWMIFVRDAGNEGDCSLDEHYLNRNAYTFFLPAPPNATPGQTPTVYNPDDTFRSNAEGLTWSMEPTTDPASNGVLVRFSFVPTAHACQSVHQGQMIHLSGVLCLGWSEASPKCDQPPTAQPVAGSLSPLDRMQIEKNPVRLVSRADQDTEIGDCKEASDNFKDSQNTWLAEHIKNPPDHSLPTILGQVRDFLGSDLGVFEELVLYNKTSQIQPNFGGRFGVIQTPLGSFEVDGAPGFSRSVKSTNGQDLSVKISDWMAGLKVQFARQLGMFAEAKGGQIFRSASAGYASTPDFSDFHGHNSFYLLGGGIQPGANVLAKGTRITVRISVDYMRITGSGENMIRVTIGPQFQFHRKGE
jgi:hypothetical protein